MYTIRIVPKKHQMDDWFLYRDTDQIVVQCWNERVVAKNFMKELL